MVSVVIPARNEEFLGQTIRSVINAAQGEIEVIAVLDGYLPDPPIDCSDIETNEKKVHFLHFPESIGQRAATNAGVREAKGEYVMKIDAHCMFDQGFDVKLSEACEKDWTVIPRMYNLHAFDWVCSCGKRYYQGGKPECSCGSSDIKKELVWKPRWHRRTDFTYFNGDLRFGYWREYEKKNEAKGDIVDVMGCLGACFFMRRDRYWELGGMDEDHGSWGQMGTEVACKAWLSGGRLVVNKKTWFSHLFRTQPEFSFPYHIDAHAQELARQYSRDLWLNNRWPGQTRTLKWLVGKFNPPGWADTSDLTIVYYTANVINPKIMAANHRSLKKFGYPIISVSQKPMDFGHNISVGNIGRSLQNIYRQVLVGAKAAKTEYVALCEDDTFYTEEHFQFRPTQPFGYNINRWLMHLDLGKYSYRDRPILSQCIARRESLINNLEERFALPEIPDKYCGEMGVFDTKLGIKDYGYETFKTELPNMVVCHNKNTMGRKLLGKDACDEIPQWGKAGYWVKKFDGTNKERQEMTEEETKQDAIQPGVITTPKPRAGMIRFGRDAKPRRQHSFIGSVILDVEETYANREAYGDPRKKNSLKRFMEVFPPFIRAAADGKEFTEQELENHPYFEYLTSKLNPVDREPQLTGKGKRHVLNLMMDAIKLYHDIKENGLKNPLDLWREPDGGFTLNRGGRRLEILHLLGYKTVPCRVFKNKEAFRLYHPRKDIVEDDSIHALAMKQFQKLRDKTTDKYWVHAYTRLYDQHIGDLRPTAKKVLEIGVYRGASLLLWRDAFPHAEIYGIDKNTRRWQAFLAGQERIKVFVGHQEDTEFLKNQVVPAGPFDIIVDDGGHKPHEQQPSFDILWKCIAPRGWYIIEDLYGNYRSDVSKQATELGFKNTVDILRDMAEDVQLKGTIKSMHFYYNICFIEKM